MQAFQAAYNPSLWSSFFSAQVSASAALTGLLFVAVSINLKNILQFGHLLQRVAKALITLLSVLLIASICLVPGQSLAALGAELVLAGALSWAITTWLQQASLRHNYTSQFRMIFYRVLTQLSAIPVLVCGVSLMALRGGGLYWLVGAVVFSFAVSLLDAWVLMIEILR